MPDVLPFHVSFLRTVDNYEKPPMRITNEEGVCFPYGRPGPASPPPPFSFSATNRGWPKPIVWPNLLHNLRRDEADMLFARSPVYGSVRGYILSDDTAAVLKRFNLGRSDLVWLEPPPDADPTVFRGAWTLWPAERYPTIYTPRRMYEAQPPFSTRVTAFTYDPSLLKITGAQYSRSWTDRGTVTYLLPCRQPDTDVDLWVDPLWPQSLFLSNRLVQALDAEGLLMGTKDGWRTRPCRAPLPEEIAEDQVQPWIRAITDHEWESMSEEAFHNLGECASGEAGARRSVTLVNMMEGHQSHMCVANVLLTQTQHRNLTDIFTPENRLPDMDVASNAHRGLRATTKNLELNIIQIPLSLDDPRIADITPDLRTADLPAHDAHIKIVWKTSNPTVYTDTRLKDMTQILVEAATRGFDTVGVHWG